MIILVMGVTGSGKTTLAKAIAAAFGWAFQEGDDLHPQANIDKMKGGVALSDADRAPWLANVRSWIDEKLARGVAGVISCSALKQAYRAALGLGRPGITLVHITGARRTIEDRLARRPAHFMPPSLLSSQLDILQAPLDAERPIIVDAQLPTPVQVAIVQQYLMGAPDRSP